MNLIITNQTDQDINMDDKLEDVITTVLETEGLSLNYEVSISFVDKDEIHRLNKYYRKVDRPTDVLSLSLIHISEPTRRLMASRMPSSA